MVYYLVEKIDEHTVRIIRYIPIRTSDAAAEFVGEDETYQVDEDDEFRSRADNLVVEPSDLILSFRDD
jgi:hypothetical protein